MITPIFTTEYSGKSLLTLLEPDKAEKKKKRSLFSICKKYNIDRPIVVDSSMTGFMELFQTSEKLGVFPRFGLLSKFTHEDSAESANWQKVIIFLKNKQAYKDLVKMNNFCKIEAGGVYTPKILKDYWTENLSLAIPHYDGWVMRNAVDGASCVPDYGDISPVYFTEHNNLPFDTLVAKKTPGGVEKIKVKSIYYEFRDDFKYWLTYRCALNYSYRGKNRTLESPNFSHCHSDDFCFESYLQEVGE